MRLLSRFILLYSCLIALPFLIYAHAALGAVIANDDSAATFANVSIMLLVLSNDEGNNLSLEIILPPAHGSVSINVGNSITYTPNAAYTGNDFFTYRITDALSGDSDIANVSIIVQDSPLSAVTAIDDAAQTNADTPIIIDVLANDLGTGIELSAIAALPQHGTASINALEGTITYMPDAGYVGTDNFAYLAANNSGASDIANVSVSITADSGTENSPPYSVWLEYCAAPMQAITICDHFFDPDGDDTYVDLNASTTTFHCSLNTVGSSDSCFRYTPLPGFLGIDTVHIVVCDDNIPPACSESIAVIHVSASGCTAPIAIADNVAIGNSLVVLNGTALPTENPYLGVLLPASTNDENPCGGETQLSITQISSPPANGTAQVMSGQIWYDPNTAFSGTDVLQYVVCNACGLCDTALMSINVAPQSGGACEISENICIAPFTTLEICPEFCTFTNPDLADIDIDASAGAIQALGNSGCFDYIPPAISSGNTNVVFTVCNIDQTICETYTAYIAITATCGDQAPVAQDDEATAIIGQSVIASVLDNDSDPEGSILSLSNIVISPNCGTAEIVANQIVFFAAADCPAQTELVYAVCDASGLCDTATLIINIETSDIDPCYNDTELCTVPFQPTELSYLEICTHFCNLGDGAHIIDANTTFHCSITLLNDTCFTYLPLPGFTGTDEVAAYACDNSGLCDTIVYTVHVGCTQPTAMNDNMITEQGQSLVISPLANDSDPCNNALTTQIAIAPQNGTVSINLDGTWLYTPNSGFVGTETITYLACSPCAASPTCDEATVSIIVTPAGGNLPPIANDDAAIIETNQASAIDIIDNDTDPDNTAAEWTTSISEQPANGSAAIGSNNILVYTPDTGFNGTDLITYVLCDPAGACDTATVILTVSPPIHAQSDIVYTQQGSAVNIYLLANDEGQNISISATNDMPNYGGITGADPETGLFTYQPQSGFVGNDYFTYIACNDLGNCDTALVVIIVLPANADNMPPVANNDQMALSNAQTTDIDVLANDADPNGNPLSIAQIVIPPLNGLASINADNTISYTPEGDAPYCDNFAYIVCDNATPALCDTAYVQVVVGAATCQNQAPIANNDVATGTDGETIWIAVLNNDTSNDDEIAQLYAASVPQYGSISPTTVGFSYMPQADFTGTDYFAYIICDAGAPTLCDTAYVLINILPQIIAAQPDIVYTNESVPVSIAVLTNDAGTDIIVNSIISNPVNGNIIVNPNGTITYSPNIGFAGIDYFEYQICDPAGNCDISIVSINILAGGGNNIAPNAVNDYWSLPTNTPSILPILDNDSDPMGGNALIIDSYTTATNGTVENNGDGTLTYTPNYGFVGIDSITYVICDNFSPAMCDTAIVVVSVSGLATAANAAPVAQNDFVVTTNDTNIELNPLDNDNDPDGDNLYLLGISPPANGIAIVAGNTVVYTPLPSFVGTDYIVYIVCDDGLPAVCDTAYITINITGEPTIDNYVMSDTTAEDMPITICPVPIAGFEPATIDLNMIPQNGIVGIDTDTFCLTYIPADNFVGLDSLSVMLCTTNDICFSVVVYITVTPLGDAPIAQNDTIDTPYGTTIEISVLGNDYDPDGDDLTAVLVMMSTISDGASVQLNPSNLSLNYTPPLGFVGTDSFAYLITDATGEWSDTAWVFVSTGENPDTLPPDLSTTLIANDDTALTTQDTPIAIDVLGNDEADSDYWTNIAVAIIVSPIYGNATINPDGTINYTPNLDFVGYDTLAYSLCATNDMGQTICDTAFIVINIISNDMPTDCAAPLMASGFSPNNDNINDLWLIEGVDAVCISQATLLIFNRWGDVVYRAENYQNNMAWNGQFRNTDGDVPDATYFYTFSYLQGDNIAKSVQGCVELRR